MSKAIDLTGQRFGRLKVTRLIGKDKSQHQIWECLCDCGNVTVVCGGNLMNGHTKSCGCLFNAIVSAKYCKSGTKLYNLTQSKSKNNTSGVKGVSWNTEKQKWQATIGLKNKLIHLGKFSTLEAAAKARALAEEQYFQPILDKYSTDLKCDLMEAKE